MLGGQGRSGRWFPERGCISEHQIFRCAKMILRDRCRVSYDLASLFRGRRSALGGWSGEIAKLIGTRPAALHSTFLCWRKLPLHVSYSVLSLKLPQPPCAVLLVLILYFMEHVSQEAANKLVSYMFQTDCCRVITCNYIMCHPERGDIPYRKLWIVDMYIYKYMMKEFVGVIKWVMTKVTHYPTVMIASPVASTSLPYYAIGNMETTIGSEQLLPNHWRG